MGKRALSLLLSLTLLSACSPTVTRPELGRNDEPSTVVVYRETAFNSGLTAMHFGEGEMRYMLLENNEYATVEMSPGDHQFLVGTIASGDFEFPVSLVAGTTTCIKAYANPANYAKILLPVLFNLTALFKAEVVACPPGNIPEGYELAID